MHSHDWQPTAAVENLRRRAEILAHIRSFFAARNVLEVETPVLSHAAVSDPFIDSIEAHYKPFPEAQAQPLYLQTSPEYAMKRLLAAGIGACYQMGKVFRNGEIGRKHNPEFSMLEWYRPGFDDGRLMDEVEALVCEVLGLSSIARISYGQLFEQELNIDPHTAEPEQLAATAAEHFDTGGLEQDRDGWLNLLMAHVLEPRLKGAVFVHDYPASQAALAQTREDANGTLVAARFELFVDGVELANGYHELTDAAEQGKRLQADQQQRSALHLPQRPLEERLVAALAAGMPECAGVALGVDRLVMLALGAASISEAISFPFERA